MRRSNIAVRQGEHGIVILLVAVVLLFVVGAMAALSIDVVTFYTARSEAQMAADGAALAAARVLANSGLTATPNLANAETLARTIAVQVATHTPVGGRDLNSPGNCNPSLEVSVCFNDNDPSFPTNPRVTVQTRRTDIPTFFARIWGSATVTVQATATAEAYNPSVNPSNPGALRPPVAPTCVKPWVLPNLGPGGGRIFDNVTGEIENPALVGKDLSTPTFFPFRARSASVAPGAWRFYVGASSSFPVPPSLPACASTFNDYQKSIAGCVQTPIACGSTVNLDGTPVTVSTHTNTFAAVNCLTHATEGSGADSIDPATGPLSGLPFQFLVGANNPLVASNPSLLGKDVLVSDSLVTVPIYNSSGAPDTGPVVVIGFVQLFLNTDGNAAPFTAPPAPGVKTMVVNIVGCGTTTAGQPILGNGASPVAVRLINPSAAPVGGGGG